MPWRRIARLLSSETDPLVTARTLVDHANACGGKDNVSVVIVDITGLLLSHR